MKLRYLLIVSACLVAVGCLPGVAVVEAQTLPITLRAQWNTPPPTENVTNYLVSVDGAPQVSVPADANAACSCIEWAFVVTAAGNHVVSVVSQNLALSTDPNSKQSSAPTAIAFRLNVPPGQPSNSKVVK